MRIAKIATLLLLGAGAAAGLAQAQDPPPYPGGDGAAAQAPDAGQLAPQDAAPVADPAAAGVDYFHSQLSPYGQWVIRPGYGEVWVPAVNVGWRPYTTGHWANTDQGWAWVADETWGWAPFHYGRWYYDAEIGWGWVPGYTWAPSWVSWRHGGGYMGWAPLPPSVGWNVGVGLVWGGVTIGAGYYTFVGMHDLLSPRIGGFIVPSVRNTTFISNTTVINNYTVVGGRVINGGVNTAIVEREIGHPVPRVAIAATSSLRGGVGAGHVGFYQPAVIARAAHAMPAEFGQQLGHQVAVQEHSHSYVALRSTPAGAGHLQGGVQGAGAANLRRAPVSTPHAGGTPAAAGGTHFRSTGAAGVGSVHSTGASGVHGTGTSSVHTTGSSAHGTGVTTSGTFHSTGTGSTTHHTTGAAGASSTGRSTTASTGTANTGGAAAGTVHSTGAAGNTVHSTGTGHPSTGAGTSGHPPPTGGQGGQGGSHSGGNTESGGKPHKPPVR